MVNRDSSLSWMSPITLERPPIGQPVSVEIDNGGGAEQLTASFIPYDHVDGGVLFVPPGNMQIAPTTSIVAQLHGLRLTLK